jgi:cobaltochelatase CobN
MRTGGDDIAQALALLGVRPVWSLGSQRVADFEILPLSILDRPRIDVTLRVSGLFRDAFAGVIDLFDAAVQAVGVLDEPDELNPIKARINAECAALKSRGFSAADARRQAGWRVFSSKPGTFGVGLQQLISAGRWLDKTELAEAYRTSGNYAYGQSDHGTAAGEQFHERLSHMDAVLQNQDNAEHDVLDSADYFEFQGGMAAASRHFGRAGLAVFHADHSNPERLRIRTLSQEISRVVRARAVNPKWISAIKRHGYRGAMEIASTVEHLFAYDAVANVVEDYQYALVADAYVLDPSTRDFLRDNNPEAFHEVCERLLEAVQRGMWAQPGDYREALEGLLIDVEPAQ